MDNALSDQTPVADNELAMLDALATAVLWLDDGLKVRYLNSAAENLFGVSARRATGSRLNRIVTIPDNLFARLSRTLLSGQPYTDRQVTIEPHGQDPIPVDCYLSPYRTPDRINGLLLELTAVDRPLRIARDEALVAQQENAGSLLRGLAHEIKNPLGGLRGAAQLLERQLDDRELHDYTSIIIREADRLQGLIDRMLGPVNRPRHEPVNLHEVLEHVRKIARAGLSTDVRLLIDYDPSIPECLTDRDRLVQVLLNVVGNAIDAVGAAGVITFRSRVISNFTIASRLHPLVAAISIHDDGCGVSPDLIEQIFYPMVSGTDRGTGLGLSIAQSMMNQLGGLIECRSEPGNTVFTILVPLELV